jgi:hypothetical protein
LRRFHDFGIASDYARESKFRLVKILPLRIEVFEYMPAVFANHAKNSKNSSRRAALDIPRSNPVNTVTGYFRAA